MTAFVKPKTWVANETVTAAKLNQNDDYIQQYINGPNIDTPQLVCKYSDLPLSWYKDDTGVLAAPVIRSFYFTTPATKWDIIVEKFAITVGNFAAGGSVTADIINVGTGLSVLTGAAPVAIANAVEVSNNNSITLNSGTQYAFLITFAGTGVESYQNTCVMLYGKTLLRS